MTTAPTMPLAASGRRRSMLDRQVAMRLAATEYERYLAALRRLSESEWSAPTACPAWDVHAMSCHVLGMAQMSSTMRETLRQMRAARRTSSRDGGLFIDALTALQVDEHHHRSPAELIERLAKVGPAAARGRRRTPALIRRQSTGEQLIDPERDIVEEWSVGFLTDVVLTRDTWMHRSDLAAATGTAMELTPDHDGVLIADVAEEWAERHGRPCSLTLTGAAGGHWTWGTGGDTVELDAETFCRVISGRGEGSGLLTTRVPF